MQWLAVGLWTRKRVTEWPSLLLPEDVWLAGQRACGAPLIASGDSSANTVKVSQAQMRAIQTFELISAAIAVDLLPRMLVAPKGIPKLISINL